MWGAFALQKLLTFFSAKNISTLDFRRTRRLNESLTNDFVKLTMLWTTGPWTNFSMVKPYCLNFRKITAFFGCQNFSSIFNSNTLIQLTLYWYEPPHDKTNKTACASIEDSDQPGVAKNPSFLYVDSEDRLGRCFWAHSEDSDQTGWMPRLICLHWVAQ